MNKDKTWIINKLVDYYCNGDNGEFAKKLGIARTTLSTWKARSSIDYDLVFAKCENLSGEWLLSGKGEMIKVNTNGAESGSYKESVILGVQAELGLIKDEITINLMTRLDLVERALKTLLDGHLPTAKEQAVRIQELIDNGELEKKNPHVKRKEIQRKP